MPEAYYIITTHSFRIDSIYQNNLTGNHDLLRMNALVAHRRCAIKEQSGVNASGTIRNKIFENRYVILVFRLVLAGTFFVSSFGKFVDIEHYSVAVVYNFDILPGPLAIAFGWALPFIELACAVSLLLGVLTRLIRPRRCHDEHFLLHCQGYCALAGDGY